MTRILLAVWCLLNAVAPAYAKELKVIDRKPVANGAIVVMELELELEPGRKDGPAAFYRYSYRTQAGFDWVFYREPVDYKKPYDWTSFEKNALPAMKFNDRRVSLFLIDWYDCIVVTAELDPAAPKVYEDRFSYACGFGLYHAELGGPDELELTDPTDPRFTTKRIRRGREGVWWLAGIPYAKDLTSRLFIFTPDYKLAQVSRNDPFSAQSRPWWLVGGFDSGCISPIMPQQERLKDLHGHFSRSKTTVALAPELAGGLDFPLSPMTDMILPPPIWNDCGTVSLTTSFEEQHIRRFLDACRAVTNAELPCFSSDYDWTVTEISATYSLWKEYSATRLAKSLHGVDDVGFLTVIEWEMARAER